MNKEKRDAYIAKLNATLDAWNAEIERLSARARQAEADTRIEYQKQIEKLKQKRTEIQQKVTEIGRSGEGAWEDLKSGLDLAWEAMNEALKSAAARFK